MEVHETVADFKVGLYESHGLWPPWLLELMDLDTVGRLDPYVNGSQLTVSVLLDENALFIGNKFMHADLYSAVPMVAHQQFFSSKVAFN